MMKGPYMSTNGAVGPFNFGYAQSATNNGSYSESGTKSFSIGAGNTGLGMSQTIGNTIIVGSINNH